MKNDTIETKIQSQNDSTFSQSYHEDQIPSSMAVALPKDKFSGNMSELDEKIKTMIYQGKNLIRSGKGMRPAYVCKICEKEGDRFNMINHIEANHLEGISIPCNICEKTSRTRDAMRIHNSKYHRTI